MIRKLEVNDVVIVNTSTDHWARSCIAVVTEIHTWGAQVEIRVGNQSVAPLRLNWDEMYRAGTINAVDEVRAERIEPVKGHHGDLFTLDEFIRDCKNGCLIDDDGYGDYATETNVYEDEVVCPSDIMAGKINRNFTHVMWYNR
jgi:hypothetical protein